jgi:hypothetical protein
MTPQRIERVLTRLQGLLEAGEMPIQDLESFLNQYQQFDGVFEYWQGHLPSVQAGRMASICRMCYEADGSVHACLDMLNLHLAKSIGCWISGCLTVRVIGVSDFTPSSRHGKRVDFADHVRDLLFILQHEPDPIIDFWRPARPLSIDVLTNGHQDGRREVARLLLEPTADLIESVKPMDPKRLTDVRDLIFRLLDVLMRSAYLYLKEGDDNRVDQIEHLIALIVKSGNIPLEFENTDSGVILYVLARPKSGRVSSLAPFDE